MNIIDPFSIERAIHYYNSWAIINGAGYVQVDEAEKEIVLAEDLIIAPTYVPDLVHACLDLIIDEEKGIWHLV
ncbi:dTDP-4-dehydrorhamnose reductase [Adhaeribacter pallidiroseus]|uniref:dTDP-4-dehydrorhamnose reductase n=2 Tax=Adhaeribacter pallidiroseus TaxID=2072847 RepID=A0A369QFL7_9BACT|nr:dTDP-4-dehydrorhamnose reductase [Adhaeribacter pallidiroseus]